MFTKKQPTKEKKPLMKIEEERKYMNGELTSHTFTIQKLPQNEHWFSYRDNDITLNARQFEDLKEQMLNPAHELKIENKTKVTILKE